MGENKGTYFGGDPVRDVGLHRTDVLLRIINRDKEVSGLTIHVIIKLQSVEQGRRRSWARSACWSPAVGQDEILGEEKDPLTHELKRSPREQQHRWLVQPNQETPPNTKITSKESDPLLS